MSKTTLAGILGAFLAIFAPSVASRLQGQAAPPITTQNTILALAIATVGKLAKDQNPTGGQQ